MLVNLQEMLALATQRSCGIGAFNTTNLESVMAVLQAAQTHEVPVIIMHAEIHEPFMSLDVIGPIMVDMAEKASVPVCVHLDHGETLPYLQRALEMGFTSIMYDGSALPYEQNVENTQKAVLMARPYSAGVEAEIGVLGGSETGNENGKASDLYTDPTLAQRFAKDTGIDALACSFGTAHGFYQARPKLDFERITSIHEMTGLPLVMHGGSGVSPEDYVRAIDRGVRKINYYSYMSLAGVQAAQRLLAQGNIRYYHDVALAVVEGMAQDVAQAMRVFYRLP